MNFDDKSDRDNTFLSFWSIRIILHYDGTLEFPLKGNEWFGQVRGHQPAKSTRETRVADCHRGLATPTCITARAWRTCRDACRDRWLAVSFEVSGRENVPGIPCACATLSFTYLVRDPCRHSSRVDRLIRKNYRMPSSNGESLAQMNSARQLVLSRLRR